jgi:hypothetical protein
MKKFLLIAVLLIAAGCYKIYNFTMPVMLDMSLPQKEQVPLRAGLYMSEDFLSYISVEEVEFGKRVYPLGKMLEDGSKKMVKAAFQDMVVISSPDEAKARKADIVISPKVESVDYNYESPSALQPPVSMAIIKWTASDTEGNIIWADTFEGKGQVKRGKGVKPNIKGGIAIDNFGLAIEDSLRKAYEEILSSGWWRKIKG